MEHDKIYALFLLAYVFITHTVQMEQEANDIANALKQETL